MAPLISVPSFLLKCNLLSGFEPSFHIHKPLVSKFSTMCIPVLGGYQKWNGNWLEVQADSPPNTCQTSLTMIFKLILDMQGLIGMRIDPRDLVCLFKSQKKNPDKLFKYSKVQVSILR
jgi:hypothetical protein